MGPVKRFFALSKFAKPYKPTPSNHNRVKWVSEKTLKEMAEQNYQRQLNEAKKVFELKQN